MKKTALALALCALISSQALAGQIQYNNAGSFGGLGVRKISTGTTDTATSTDYLIAWNSATSGSKTQTIPACSSSLSGKHMIVKDEYGNAATYQILVTPASGTIDGVSYEYLYTNYQSVTLVCDGSSNWMVI